MRKIFTYDDFFCYCYPPQKNEGNLYWFPFILPPTKKLAYFSNNNFKPRL